MSDDEHRRIYRLPSNDALLSKIEQLEEKQRDQESEIRSLKKWKEHCTMAAAGWGGICMAVLTMGGILHSYWNTIKYYFVSDK